MLSIWLVVVCASLLFSHFQMLASHLASGDQGREGRIEQPQWFEVRQVNELSVGGFEVLQNYVSIGERDALTIPLRGLFALELLDRCEGRPQLAAKILGISRGAFSRQLSRLEQDVDTDVVRGAKIDGRRFELTEIGLKLVAATRVAYPDLLNFASSIQEALEGAGPRLRNGNAAGLRDS